LATSAFPVRTEWTTSRKFTANDAKLRAAQAASLSEKDKFEEVAMEWSALAQWAEQKQR
jgi:hypothetical protein